MMVKFKDILVGNYFLIGRDLYFKTRNATKPNGLGEARSIGVVIKDNELLVNGTNKTVNIDPENFYETVNRIVIE